MPKEHNYALSEQEESSRAAILEIFQEHGLFDKNGNQGIEFALTYLRLFYVGERNRVPRAEHTAKMKKVASTAKKLSEYLLECLEDSSVYAAVYDRMPASETIRVRKPVFDKITEKNNELPAFDEAVRWLERLGRAFDFRQDYVYIPVKNETPDYS